VTASAAAGARARAALAADQLDDVAAILESAGQSQLAGALRIVAIEIGLGQKTWQAKIVERLLRRPSVTAGLPTQPLRGGIDMAPIGEVELRTYRRPLWGTDGGYWRLALRVPDRRGWHIFGSNPRGAGPCTRSHTDRDDIVDAPGWEPAKVELPALVAPSRKTR
jgi:hypothetical protein